MPEGEEMPLQQKLRKLAREIIDEAERNPAFAARLDAALGEPGGTAVTKGAVNGAAMTNGATNGAATPVAAETKRKGAQRRPALIDPIALARTGEPNLRSRLADMSMHELKDIVADYAMDSSGEVMKWRSVERITDRIVENALGRAYKGSAFLS
jgi:hypothetical protein